MVEAAETLEELKNSGRDDLRNMYFKFYTCTHAHTRNKSN